MDGQREVTANMVEDRNMKSPHADPEPRALSKEELDEIANDEFVHAHCRHKYRFEGSVSVPEENYRATILTCRADCGWQQLIPRKKP